MVIVLENRDFGSVIGDASAPYINNLAARGGLATNAFGQAHPSLPNYLTLIAGTTFGITSDCTSCTVEGPTLPDQLEAAGFRWRAYMESMPQPCYGGVGSNGGYARKHDPFLYFPQIANAPGRCADVVPMNEMSADLASASPPDFVFAVPNLCDDGHDCGTATTDAWMARTLPGVFASPWYAAGGVLIVTWDEGTEGSCCSGAYGGHIATIVVSARTPAGSRLVTPVDHAGTLRTIEALYHLPYLANAACACSGSLLPLLGQAP